jgi:hypothetical protein
VISSQVCRISVEARLGTGGNQPGFLIVNNLKGGPDFVSC